jgi:hypothetical protein
MARIYLNKKCPVGSRTLNPKPQVPSEGCSVATWIVSSAADSISCPCLTASAPIWTYKGERPAYDAASYAKGVTYDATPEAGSAEACVPNVRAAWKALFDLGGTEGGRAAIHAHMRLCADAKLKTVDDVWGLVGWAHSAWDFMVRRPSLRQCSIGKRDGWALAYS